MMASPAATAAEERTDDAAQLLAHHQRMLDAHLQADVDMMLANSTDDYISANRGVISHTTVEQRRAGIEPYFEAARFTTYRDMVPPVVNVSEDGTLGWVIVQVEAEGVVDTPEGDRPLAFQSAWIELYEKRDGRWMQVGNVSNFAPTE